MRTTSIIPQMFYDLISRIVPGAILIASAWIISIGPTEATRRTAVFLSGGASAWPPGFLTFVALVAGSYVVSNVLAGLRELWFAVVCKFWKAHRVPWTVEAQCTKAGLADLEAAARYPGTNLEVPKTISLPSVPFMYAFVRYKAPDAGATVVKLRAEERMYAALARGWGLLTLVGLFFLPRCGPWEALGTECVLIALVFAMVCLKKRRRHQFDRDLCTHWFLFASSRERSSLSPGRRD